MSKALKLKAKQIDCATVPSCVARYGDELLCFHGAFDDQYDRENRFERFMISFLNAKTFKVLRAERITVGDENLQRGNLFDLEVFDPTYTRMALSPGGKYLAVTLGHEDYTAAVVVDLRSMTIVAIEDHGDQHDQARVLFLSDTVALLSYAGHEYSPWQKFTEWTCEESERDLIFKGDFENEESYTMLGSNLDQTLYAVRRRFREGEDHDGVRDTRSFRSEITFCDINTDEVVRTISFTGRPLSSNVAISGDFETLWDWLGAEEYRAYDSDCYEVKIWKTLLSSDSIELSTLDASEEVVDAKCDFIHVENMFFRQQLCDGKVTEDASDSAYTNLIFTEDKAHFVVGNGAGVVKVFSALSGELELTASTGVENELSYFSQSFYAEQYNAVVCGGQLVLFGYAHSEDEETPGLLFALPLPEPPPTARRARAAAGTAPALQSDKRRSSDVTAAAVAPKGKRQRAEAKEDSVSAADATEKSTNDVSSIYLECCEGTSNKFYRIEVLEGCSVVCHYGPIGSQPGNRVEKTFKTQEEATAFALKTADEKRRKGYVDAITPASDDDSFHAELNSDKVSGRAAAGCTYLECKEGTSNKFYRIETIGATVICHYGAIAAKPGVRVEKSFESHEDAVAHAERIASEKRKKKYRDCTEQ